MANYWRIGSRTYFEDNPNKIGTFKEGYPFVWGDTVSNDTVSHRFEDVDIGDIIVAGGTEYIDFIGVVQEKPKYIEDSITREDEPYWLSDSYGIETSSDDKALTLFNNLGLDDVIYVKTKWFNIDCSELKMPRQQISAFHELNVEGKAYIQNILKDNGYHSKEDNMAYYLKLLKENKNLVLTGAPGTGKTYLAKQIAMQMILGYVKDEKDLSDKEKELWKKHYCFVQFHPSYDYTDFVEGLRPKAPENDDENIGFELKDGVFKDFCKRVVEAQVPVTPTTENFDKAWERLIEKLGEESPLVITPGLSVYLTERGKIRDENPYYGSYTKENIYNVYLGQKGRPSGAFNGRMNKILKYLVDNFNLQPKPQIGTLDLDIDNSANQSTDTTANPDKDLPYIFVIDEINRGEISKIFGELFFSIDPGYRGKDGKVLTQYANMARKETTFDPALNEAENDSNGWFYVPENVYIIGTMNDIDRSVESMDFAMRRRFVFQEVTAEESAKNMGLPDATNKRMKALNDEISRIQGLNSSYHIGGAYFLTKGKDGKTVEPDYDELWTLRLKPLLKEYLRGMPDADTKLKNLKAAYDLSATEQINKNENDGQ